MLVLSRRVGESLKIGDDIWVEVLVIGGNQVKIGISAPQSVVIVREELLDDAKDEELRHP